MIAVPRASKLTLPTILRNNQRADTAMSLYQSKISMMLSWLLSNTELVATQTPVRHGRIAVRAKFL